MSILDNAKQSSAFKKEYDKKRSKINNLEDITDETIRLETFVVKYDRDRYLQKLSESSSVDDELIETAYIFAGLADFYDAVLREGIEAWSDDDILEEEWKKLFAFKMLKTMADDKVSALASYGWQLGIIGLMNGCLYYDLTGNYPKINKKLLKVKSNYDEKEIADGKIILSEIMNTYSFAEIMRVIEEHLY